MGPRRVSTETIASARGLFQGLRLHCSLRLRIRIQWGADEVQQSVAHPAAVEAFRQRAGPDTSTRRRRHGDARGEQCSRRRAAVGSRDGRENGPVTPEFKFRPERGESGRRVREAARARASGAERATERRSDGGLAGERATEP